MDVVSFEFIQSASRPFLRTPPPAGEVRPSGNPRRQLRADYQRWSRLGIGAIGVVLSASGALFAVGITFSGVRLTAFDIIVVVIGLVFFVVGAWLLIRLHLSGRAVLTALAWWTAETYRSGASARSAAGWAQARTVNYEPPIFVRITASSLLGLFGLMGICMLWYPVEPGELDLRAAMIAVGIILTLTSIGQMGGVMRLVSGLAEADPLWTRIRDAFRRG